MAAEVAIQQLDGIRTRILAEGDNLDDWLGKANLSAVDWQNLDHRISWAEYAQILELVYSRRSEEWIRLSGERSIQAPEAHLFRSGLLIGFDDSCAALEWMCGPAGPFAAVNPFLDSTLQRQSPNKYCLRTVMLGGLKPSVPHQYFAQGVLIAFPRVLSERPAQVEVEPRADGANYYIQFGGNTALGALRRRWHRTRSQPEYLAGIGETYLALINRQIELQEQQEKVKQAELRSVRMEKQESLGYLTSGVAHDFRNILTIIQAQIELAQLNTEGIQKERLNEALNACHRGADLTARLISYVREAPVTTEQVDVGEALNAVKPLLEQGLGQKGELRVQVAEYSQKISVERSLFENALLNLVLNAGDAMERNGIVTIQSELTKILEDSSLATDCPPGDYVKISVQDNGSGIDPSIAAKVFDPYFTTKDKGTGLGLSSVWGFVKQHGGHVVLASHVDQGSRFDLYFPQPSHPT